MAIGYHRKCYMLFTNEAHIERAQKKKEKAAKDSEGEPQKEPQEATQTLPVTDVSLPKVRILRSEVEDPGLPRRASHLLPVGCLICMKNQYITGYNRKRTQEKLSKCETITANKLLLAAESRRDEMLLLQIRGRDLVASEARYHQSCYKKYTYFLYKKAPQCEEETPYESGFKALCKTVVEEKILRKREIFRLSQLNDVFKKIVQEQQNTDISSYTVSRLKARLEKAYPCLKFLKASRNYIVFVEDLCAEEVVPDVAMQSSSDSDEDTDNDQPCHVTEDQKHRVLYHAAMSVKEAVQEKYKANAKMPWPPTAQDLNICTALSMIPPELYNLIAWTVGISTEIPTESECVCVGEEENLKIVSICQDIMYFATRGRWPMVKHTALAMTIRHMTGSAQLIGILNGLGHCSSNSQVLEHDTALAELQLQRGDTHIPPTISPHVPATLVWDNNDFGEETLSGKGTTHNTNGIIIQRPISGCVDVLPLDVGSLKKTGKRSLQPPSTKIDVYTRVQKANPKAFGEKVELGHDQYSGAEIHARQLDSAYFFMKTSINDHTLPGWTGWNTQLHESDIPQQSKIGYLPVIDASPTNFNTVHTILTRSIEIADKLELTEIVLVMDQAIYAKAQEIRWANTTFMERIVLRLGEFHTSMAYLSCIGKRFGDAGFQDIITEAEVVAAGSMEGILTGHQYNRSIRTHKLMCESLQRLRWQGYLDQLPQDSQEAAVKLAIDLESTFPGADFDALVMSEKFTKLLGEYNSYIKDNSTNKTFTFWSSYIQMVEDLLLFIRGTREANWSLHLSSVRCILPWFFSYDRINYARYLTAYWVEMANLEHTHPTASNQLQSGDFVAQRQQLHGFACTACDQVIEQTVNRDSKTKGGLTGYSLHKGAVHRWTLTHHERAAITVECREMAGHSSTTKQRAELYDTRSQQDEKDVRSIMSTINNMMNPFDPSIDADALYHIASGKEAPALVTTELNEAKERGEKAFLEFCETRLQSNDVAIHHPLKKMKLKTFKDISTTCVTKNKGREIALKADCDLFARMIVIGMSRKINMDEMLIYSLGPLPAALAHFDGSIMKTDKSKLLHHLEGAIHPPATVDSIPRGSTWVWDGMALVQTMKPQPTFGMFADSILRMMVTAANATSSTVVHFVPDTYRTLSIKNAERDRRAVKGCQVLKIYAEDQKIPKQWSQFLACGENKDSLLEFFYTRWCKSAGHLMEDLTIIVGHRGECHALKKEKNKALEVTPINNLYTTQEEADTRLFLHCKHAVDYSSHIVVSSPDTDVFILALAFSQEIAAHLYFNTGKGLQTRTIEVQRIQQHLGSAMCDALIGLHCFTGCDTVSSLYGVGKVKALNTLLSSTEHCQTFQEMGKSFDINPNLYEPVEAFTCELYNLKGIKSVNKARWHMFKAGKSAERSLPPNQDSLQQHIKRANYQAAIYRRSLQARPEIPSPVEHGWHMEGNSLMPQWMTLPPAPKSVLELVHCQCKSLQCVKGNCTCRKHSLPCTELCNCKNCENV